MPFRDLQFGGPFGRSRRLRTGLRAEQGTCPRQPSAIVRSSCLSQPRELSEILRLLMPLPAPMLTDRNSPRRLRRKKTWEFCGDILKGRLCDKEFYIQKIG